jgi:hypothetical protein
MAGALRRRPLRAVLLLLAASALAVTGSLVWASYGGAGNGPDQTAASSGAGPTALSGSGLSKKFDGVAATDSQCTTSTSFADIPGTAQAFTISGTASTQVVAMFQSEWFNQARALLRLTIDNVVQSGPGDSSAPFAANSGNDAGAVIDQTNGFNFISDSVAPGAHTARIQWASVSGGQICVDERTLIVLHK